MRVAPYHSKSATSPDIYHDYGDCIVGRRIPVHHRQEGNNNWPLCKICANR